MNMKIVNLVFFLVSVLDLLLLLLFLKFSPLVFLLFVNLREVKYYFFPFIARKFNGRDLVQEIY